MQYNCRDCAKVAQVAWKDANKDHIRSYASAWKDANRDHVKSYTNNYYDGYRDGLTLAEKAAKGSVVTARNRSDLSSSDLYGGLSFNDAWAETIPFAEERLRLEAETGVAHHIDHIIPIKAGGTHTKDNLQVLTAVDNIAKAKEDFYLAAVYNQ